MKYLIFMVIRVSAQEIRKANQSPYGYVNHWWLAYSYIQRDI
jgi:hypothetical protein